jgi:hypothetical protein
MATSPEFSYLTYSYVVIVGGPGGDIQWDGNKLSQVFGKYGRGNVVQFPAGVGVILGDFNQLIVQPPKISFKAAIPDMLFELYRNSRRMILAPFIAHKSTAFGVNFEIDVGGSDLEAHQILRQLLSKSVPSSMTLKRAQLQSGSTFLNIEQSTRDEKKLFVIVNNEIKDPDLSSWDVDTITTQFEDYKGRTENTIRELLECLHKPHS